MRRGLGRAAHNLPGWLLLAGAWLLALLVLGDLPAVATSESSAADSSEPA